MDKCEYFEDIYNTFIRELKERKKLIKENKGNIPRIYRTIENDESVVGIIEFCYKNNILESKKDFFKSSLAREWTYKAYDNKEYEIDKDFVTTYVYESLFYAVLSGSKERAIYMANLFGGREKEEKNDFLPNILLGYGLKYIILNDNKNASKYIDKLEENKDKRVMKQYYNGYRNAYKGIVDRDDVLFNEGLEFMLKKHKARMKKNGNTLEQFFAYDSIALAMIAKERGINITVNHELLPIEYLEPVNINYDEIKLFE